MPGMRSFCMKNLPRFINHTHLAPTQPKAGRRIGCCPFSPLLFSSRGAASAQRSSTREALPNFYKRLQLEMQATPEEIKAAYRRRALECHPDVVESNQRAQAEVKFRGVSEAYEVLSDPEKRRVYDQRLGIEPPLSATTTRTTTTTKATRGASAAVKAKATASADPRRGPQASSTWRKKPFVRGDADRTFAEAFNGKTVAQILFEMRRRSRLRETSPNDDNANDKEEVWLQAVARAAARLERGYGPSILRQLRVRTSLPRGPGPAPAAHMPFRPFLNAPLPAGVTAPPTPQMGPLRSCTDSAVEVVVPDMEAQRKAAYTASREKPDYFYTHTQPSGVKPSAIQRLNKVEKTIMGAAHNMGMLYSYHRPY